MDPQPPIRSYPVEMVATFQDLEPVRNYPANFRVSNNMMLILSTKQDQYYTVTPDDCSCPSRTYHPEKRCKHMNKFFPQTHLRRMSIAQTLEEHERNLPRLPWEYQRMVHSAREMAACEPSDISPAKWPGNHNGPVIE